MLAELDLRVNTGETKMTALKFARTSGVEMLVVVAYQPFAACRIGKYPVLERLTECVLRVSRLNRFFDIGNTLFLAVYDFYIADLYIPQVKRQLQQIISIDARSTIFGIRQRMRVVICTLIGYIPELCGIGIRGFNLIQSIKRRV